MKTSIRKGALFFSFSTFAFLISGYLINVILGRIFNPSEYGIYGILISILSLVNIIQTNGITQACSKFLSESKFNAHSILKSGFILQNILSLFLFTLFFFQSTNIAILLNDVELVPYIKIIACIFPLYGMYGLYLDYYNGLHFFKKQAIMIVIFSTFKIFILLPFAYFVGIKGVFYGIIIALFIPLLYGFKVPHINIKLFPLKKIIYFSLPVFGVAIFSNLLLSSDLFFIKLLHNSNEDLGFYTANQNISRLAFFGMSPILMVLLPHMSQSVSNSYHIKISRSIEYATRILLLILLPVILFISAKSNQIIEIIYSSKYLPASNSLSILVIGVFFFTIYTAQAYIFIGSGRPVISWILGLIGWLISIFLYMILIPQMGLSGAAISMAIGSLVSLIIGSVIIYRIFDVLISLRSLIKIFSTSLIFYIITLNTNFPNIFLPLAFIILFGIYIGLLIWSKELIHEDLIELKKLIPEWFFNRKKLNTKQQ